MWRKMTRTSWIEHKTSEAVLNEVNEERTVTNTKTKRKIKLIGKAQCVKTRVKELEEKSSVGWVVPLSKVSRGRRHVTDMIGFNNNRLGP